MMVRVLSLLIPGCLALFAADAPKSWPIQVTRIEIPSSDGTKQPAMWFAPAVAEKRPLLVGLHTWSSSYDSAGGDALYAEWCIARGWAFIHPHFRGPNRTPLAMGSDRAVQDVVEAVEWAKQQTNIDEDRVYLIGVSGGGHMALLMAGRHPELWAGVSAWCGISDIAAWHAEHVADGMPDEYARDIESALGRAPLPDDPEAWKRSPLSCLAAASVVPLDINHGIDDGRKGSVRFTHSLRAFNAVVTGPARLDSTAFATFYDTRTRPHDWPEPGVDPSYGGRKLIFRTTHARTRLTLFEGGHEILHQAALNWLTRQHRGRAEVWSHENFIPLNSTPSSAGK